MNLLGGRLILPIHQFISPSLESGEGGRTGELKVGFIIGLLSSR